MDSKFNSEYQVIINNIKKSNNSLNAVENILNEKIKQYEKDLSTLNNEYKIILDTYRSIVNSLSH